MNKLPETKEKSFEHIENGLEPMRN